MKVWFFVFWIAFCNFWWIKIFIIVKSRSLFRDWSMLLQYVCSEAETHETKTKNREKQLNKKTYEQRKSEKGLKVREVCPVGICTLHSHQSWWEGFCDADDMNRFLKLAYAVCHVVVLLYCVADIQMNGCPKSLACRFIYQLKSRLLLGWRPLTKSKHSNNGNSNKLKFAPATVPSSLRLPKVCTECVKNRTNFMK